MKRWGWGWSPGAQENAEFTILSAYFSALLGVPAKLIREIQHLRWNRKDAYWQLTLWDGATLTGMP